MFSSFMNSEPSKPSEDDFWVESSYDAPETPIFNTEKSIENLVKIKPEKRKKLLDRLRYILSLGQARLNPEARKKNLARIIDLEEAGHISDNGPIREEYNLRTAQKHNPIAESSRLNGNKNDIK